MATITKTPLLRAGDHLTVEEFELRYEAMANVKAELIEGVVYMPSPVRAHEHGEPHFDLITFLGTYKRKTPGVCGSDNATVKLEVGENEPQPDAHLRIPAELGGQTRLENGYVIGPPELVAEIAASSVSYDLHPKLEAYRKNGIREYLIWRVEDEAIDWFVLRDGHYEPLSNRDGILRSEVFPGLWLEAQAWLAGDFDRVYDALQQGIESPEHKTFVAKLNASP